MRVAQETIPPVAMPGLTGGVLPIGSGLPAARNSKPIWRDAIEDGIRAGGMSVGSDATGIWIGHAFEEDAFKDEFVGGRGIGSGGRGAAIGITRSLRVDVFANIYLAA